MVRIRPGFRASLEGAISHPSYPPAWERARSNPWLFFARKAFLACQPWIPDLSPTPAATARVVCISDTHSQHDKLPPLPPGDILIHAGDLTESGGKGQVDKALAWLHAAPHPYKIVIAGNHDTVLAEPTTRDAFLAKYPGLIYLEDSSATIEVRGRLLTVYGSPRTPSHGSGVFRYSRQENVWNNVPAFTDILVTHGPPQFHLDVSQVGCPHLLATLYRHRPALHVFGHIHASRGLRCLDYGEAQRLYEDVNTNTNAEKDKWNANSMLKATLSLLRLLATALLVKVRGRPRFRSGEHTVLVNACSMAGYWSELLRRAIVVDVPLPDRA